MLFSFEGSMDRRSQDWMIFDARVKYRPGVEDEAQAAKLDELSSVFCPLREMTGL